MKLLLFLISGTAAAALPIADVTRESPVDFARDLHPILQRNCLACHNQTKSKAGLNLESPASILQGGDTGPAVVPGRSSESLLLKTAAHLEDPIMPPAGNKVNAVDLTPEELGLFRLWIDQGAAGEAVTADAPIVWRGFPAQRAPVTAAAVSPGGVLVAAARGNQVEITEVATGVSLGFLSDPELARLDLYRGHPAADRDAVVAVAFGNEDRLATGGYRTARLWRREAFRPHRDSLVLTNPVLSLATGGALTAAGDATGCVVVWNAHAEKPEPVELNDHTSPVRAVALTPDGRHLISAAADRSVRVWSVSDRTVVFRGVSPVEIVALAVVQRGELLAAAGADGSLRVYGFSTADAGDASTPLREVRLGDKAPAFLTSIDPQGSHVLWGGGDDRLRVVDAATGEPLREIRCQHPAQPVLARAERQREAAQRQVDGRQQRATAAAEAAKKEGDAARTAQETMEKARADWQRKLATAAQSAESARSKPADTPRQEAATKAMSEANAAERVFLNARADAELAVRLAGQALQRQITAEAAQAAARTSLAEAQANLDAAKATAPFPAVTSATVLPDGRTVVLATAGNRAQWHSLETGALVDAAELEATMTAVTQDALIAVSTDKKSVLLPLRRAWRHERTLGATGETAVLSDRVTALAFSSDSRLLATGGGIPSRGGEVSLWNTHDGSLARTLKDPHSDTVNALAFSPDDAWLATAGSDRFARIFRVADGEKLADLEGHASHVLGIAWRGDGLALATGGADKTVRTWDALDARQIGSNSGFGKEVSAVAWLGTGDVVASASGDAAVRLNDERLPGGKGFLFCLSVDRAGSLLAAGGEDGVLRLWYAADKKLLRELAPASPAD
jgi:WD40 repeat protein